MKNFFYSIKAMITLPFVGLTVLILIAYFVLYYLLSTSFHEMQLKHVESYYNIVSDEIYNENRKLQDVIKNIGTNFTLFVDAVEEDDQETMDWLLSKRAESSYCDGYIYTNLYGAVIATNFEGQVSTDIEAVVDATVSKNTQVGYGTFIDGFVFDYASAVIRNAEQEDLGVVFFINKNINNRETLTGLKTKTGIDYYVFLGESCINSSDRETNLSTVKLDSLTTKNVFTKERDYVGTSKMFGATDYIAALPFKDPSGSVIGAMLIRTDAELTQNILQILFWLLPVVIVALGGFMLIMGLTMNRRILKPMKQMLAAIEPVSKGDLRHDIYIDRACTEVAELGENVIEMQQRIRAVITPVSEISSQIVSLVNHLARAAQTLSNAANRQAASLQEISSSMEEMGANIQQNTDNSVQTSRLAEEINKRTQALGDSSNNSYEAIKNITQNLNNINDLVSQTNILALNASVEAARAGELGLGFGVVAKEVGRLADQTQDTASDINDFAESSITETEAAHTHVTQLIPMIETITSLVKEITTASFEQNTGCTQINSAIMDLNRVTQENAASAEEVSANSNRLQEMIRQLNKAVRTFKV